MTFETRLVLLGNPNQGKALRIMGVMTVITFSRMAAYLVGFGYLCMTCTTIHLLEPLGMGKLRDIGMAIRALQRTVYRAAKSSFVYIEGDLFGWSFFLFAFRGYDEGEPFFF